MLKSASPSRDNTRAVLASIKFNAWCMVWWIFELFFLDGRTQGPSGPNMTRSHDTLCMLASIKKTRTSLVRRFEETCAGGLAFPPTMKIDKVETNITTWRLPSHVSTSWQPPATPSCFRLSEKGFSSTWVFPNKNPKLYLTEGDRRTSLTKHMTFSAMKAGPRSIDRWTISQIIECHCSLLGGSNSYDKDLFLPPFTN